MLQRRIAGNTEVTAISVSAQDGVFTEKVQRDIERLLRERRRIGPGKEDDFHVRDMQQLVSTLAGTTRVLTALLGSVWEKGRVRIHPLPESEKWVDTVFIRHREAYATSSLRAFLDIARPAIARAVAAE